MNERDDESELRAAFARLREDEAQRAPQLARVIARAEAARAAGSRGAPWLRIALPLAGAAAAGFVWWIGASAPSPSAQRVANAPLPQGGDAHAVDAPRLIALGSLRSPTDVLLAPPLPALGAHFSRSLIPAPPPSAPPRGDDRSQLPPARRYPA